MLRWAGVSNHHAIMLKDILRAAAIGSVYLAVGVAFYTTFEDKACEDDSQPDPLPPKRSPFAFGKPPPFECREPWTLVDALYFCMVSMSTVGYGDFSPTSDYSRMFSLIYILVGISIVFVEISNACSGILMKTREALLGVLDRFDATPHGLAGRKSLGFSGQPIDIDGNGVADFVLPPSGLVFWGQEIAIMVPLMLGMQFLSAFVFVHVQPGLTLGDSMYHTLITATTVGYGDVELTTQLARLWAVRLTNRTIHRLQASGQYADYPFDSSTPLLSSATLQVVHILFSVTWLAALLSHIDELSTSRQSEHTHEYPA